MAAIRLSVVHILVFHISSCTTILRTLLRELQSLSELEFQGKQQPHIDNPGRHRCHVYFNFLGDAHQVMLRVSAQGHWQHVHSAVPLCRA